MAADLDLEVPRNGDYFQTWDLEDTDGVRTDLTGHTIAMSAKAVAGTGSVIASATIEILPDKSSFSVRWHGPDFDSVPGTTEIVRVAYDLRHTFPDGIVEIPVRGQLILIPEVTT